MPRGKGKPKEKVKPGIKISLDKERVLLFDLNAMVAFEDSTGKTLSDGIFTNTTRVSSRVVGTGDGKTTEFSLDNAPIEGSLKLYIDGSLQIEGTDFMVDVAILTFTKAPRSGAKVTADYIYQSAMSPRNIRAMLWACFLHEDETLTLKQVGSWVTVSNVLEITAKLIEAFEVAMPESEGEEAVPLVRKSPG